MQWTTAMRSELAGRVMQLLRLRSDIIKFQTHHLAPYLLWPRRSLT